ncbi:protein TolR [Geminicoccaceae bacterium 1502E]|nr:protein TolR [Geminicoccaceae bacterium 1502E]
MAGTAMAGGRGRRNGRRRRRGFSEINVTPMVDVMLVLLIVFMVTAPLLTTGVAVDLPQATSSPLPGQDEPLSVTVAADGKIYVQESAIELEGLGPRLLAVTERNPNARIFVRGDKAIDYGRIMAVVSAINQAGFAKVALLTEAPAARTAALPGGQTR